MSTSDREMSDPGQLERWHPGRRNSRGQRGKGTQVSWSHVAGAEARGIPEPLTRQGAICFEELSLIVGMQMAERRVGLSGMRDEGSAAPGSRRDSQGEREGD